MPAVLTEPKTQILVEEHIVLHGISWKSYDQLMKDYENRSSPRFTYNQGNLEIYMPSEKHEETGELLARIVYAILEERDLDFRGLRSTTFRRKNADKGVEPDGSFYIQSVEKVKNLTKINLEKHPPPDLIIEVDITSPSINRFPIYAEFKVKEIWRYLNDEVKIHLFDGKKYFEADESLALPKVTGELLTNWLAESETMKRSAWLKNIRNWVNQ